MLVQGCLYGGQNTEGHLGDAWLFNSESMTWQPDRHLRLWRLQRCSQGLACSRRPQVCRRESFCSTPLVPADTSVKTTLQGSSIIRHVAQAALLSLVTELQGEYKPSTPPHHDM